MATVLLSNHSSNPLEVGSSDPRNSHYHRAYRKSQEARRDDPLSSDDLLNEGYRPPELDDYHDHISSLFPGMIQRRSSMSTVRAGKQPMFTPPTYVDLDVDMSDDELLIRRNDVQPATVELNDEDNGQASDEDDDVNLSGEQDSEDEEDTIHLKPPEERAEIEAEIEELESSVPQLTSDYKLVDRLGTGTFSSVYKAIDLAPEQWDNIPWQGPKTRSSIPQLSSAYINHAESGGRVFVAIKRIYVTSSPERIRNEIAIMETCRGSRYTSQLITAFRYKDQVVAIMPYHKNEDFREYFREISMPAIKAYLRCMLRALRDIHARGIIHRDVKPANFLFDPRSGVGTLCDFGLACRMEPARGHGNNACLHTPPTRSDPHGRVRLRNEYNIELIKRMQKEARIKGTMSSDKVGYLDKDTRPSCKANRAGTRGFRAPEVLLKCGDQSGAVDVWSAGMILLFFLIGKFPLFQSNDDIEALMEIAVITGRKSMEKVATLHSRTFASNVPSITPDGISWREFVEKQNPDVFTPPPPNTRYYPYTMMPPSAIPSISMPPPPLPPSKSTSVDSSLRPKAPTEHAQDVEFAFSLMEGLLHPESTRRITPRDALNHPFLRDPKEPDDDEMFPHPYGEGVCGHLHFMDEVTEEPCVRVKARSSDEGRRRRSNGTDDEGDTEAGERDEEDMDNGDWEDGTEVIVIRAGEGIAVGSQPCEFHRDEFYSTS